MPLILSKNVYSYYKLLMIPYYINLIVDIKMNINENVSYPFSDAWVCWIQGFGGHGLEGFVETVIKN